MVITAPTIVRNAAIPGKPFSFGVMLISTGTITRIARKWAIRVAGFSSIGIDSFEMMTRRRASPPQVHRLRQHWSEAAAEVDQEVHPRGASTGQGGSTNGNPQSCARPGGRLVVAVCIGDGPCDRADDQHQHGDDEDEGQQGTDDGGELTGAADTAEVRINGGGQNTVRRKEEWVRHVEGSLCMAVHRSRCDHLSSD